MKQALISLVFCWIFLSANSQVFLRQEILENLKTDDKNEYVKLLNDNSVLIYENNLITNKELYILYLLNDSLIATDNEFWEMKGYFSDSLTNYLFNRATNEKVILEKKIEQLSSNKAETDFNNLFLEQIIAPEDEQSFSKKEFISHKKYLLNFYKNKIESCPDSLYTKFKSLRMRKESMAIYFSGTFYQTENATSRYVSQDMFQNESVRYGVGIGISRTIGIFKYDYGLNINSIESKTLEYSHYPVIQSSKSESQIKLGWNTSYGFNLINNKRISFSTMFHANFASFKDFENYASTGIKSDITIKFPVPRKAYHTTDGYITGRNCIILSTGYTWGAIENYFVTVSFGLNMDVLRQKVVFPRK